MENDAGAVFRPSASAWSHAVGVVPPSLSPQYMKTRAVSLESVPFKVARPAQMLLAPPALPTTGQAMVRNVSPRPAQARPAAFVA